MAVESGLVGNRGSGNLTEEFVQQLMEISFNNLTSSTIRKTKLSILDAVGCAVYGSQTEWSKIITDYIREFNAKERSTVLFEKLKTEPSLAALANGTMIHSYELDDVFMEGKLHPGAPVISAALSVAEDLGSSGRDIIESIVTGYEAMGRVALALGANAAKVRGWHITGVCGTFGAAAAASKLLDLDAEKFASAMGTAGTQSSGLFAFTADGSMTKRFHPGRASQSGVMASYLAKMGFKGPRKILEASDGGFLKAFSDSYDFSRIYRNPGDKLIIDRSGFKLYSCCGSIHPALDAAKTIVIENDISPEDVSEVKVGVSSVVNQQCGFDYTPLSVLQAQMSLQYSLSAIIKYKKAFIEQFKDDLISSPELLSLSRKVKVYNDEKAEKAYPKQNPATVTIKLKNNKSYTLYVDEPTGLSERFPPSEHELFDKFYTLCKTRLDTDATTALKDTIMGLDMESNITNLLDVIN